MINNKENKSIIIWSLSLAFILGAISGGIIQFIFENTLLTMVALVIGAYLGGFRGAFLGQKYSRAEELRKYFNPLEK